MSYRVAPNSLKKTPPGQENPHAEALQSAADEMLELFDKHRSVVDLLLDPPPAEPINIASGLRDLCRAYSERHLDGVLRYSGPESVLVSAIPAITTGFQTLIERVLNQPDLSAPQITIQVTDGSPVEIEVRDTGSSIPRMEYTFLDEPEALSTIHHPSGLGLWAVYIAVSHSRGTLTIDQPDATGNRITIELPTPSQPWS